MESTFSIRVGQALSLILLISVAPTATAGDTACTGILDGVHDSIVVPEGRDCTLVDAAVRGNIEVKSRGSLSIQGQSYVHGNVQSDGGQYVRLVGGMVTIGGNVHIKKASDASGYLPGTRIEGNFQYEESSGLLIAVGGLILGDLQMSKNTGGGIIGGNTIRANLQCKENFPAPTGSENDVGGSKEDQCAPL
jgi:hypothetical protein